MAYAAPGYHACGAAVKYDTRTVGNVGIIGLRIIFCKRHDTAVNYYQTIYEDTALIFKNAVWTNFF